MEDRPGVDRRVSVSGVIATRPLEDNTDDRLPTLIYASSRDLSNNFSVQRFLGTQMLDRKNHLSVQQIWVPKNVGQKKSFFCPTNLGTQKCWTEKIIFLSNNFGYPKMLDRLNRLSVQHFWVPKNVGQT